MNTIKSTIYNSIEFLIVGNRHLQIKIINFILSKLESRKDKLVQKNIEPFMRKLNNKTYLEVRGM